MKIKKVHLKNLASLAGEWTVNFEDPELTRNGIFAIVGHTGTGKSTIFDAICLGLYGKTPRLTYAFTKERNDIMSVGASECFAEVTFEIDGESGREVYVGRWSQAANTKVGAKYPFTDSRHELSRSYGDATSPVPVKLNKSEVANRVTELTGLSFDQFSQAMMLSQGKFQKFLEAAPKDRAELLQKLTGNTIYQRIVRKVKDKKAETKKLEEGLKAILEGVQLLSDEEVAAEQQCLKDVEQKLSLQEEELTKLKALLDWRKDFDRLLEEQCELVRERAKLDLEENNFASCKAELARALAAKEVKPVYTEVSTQRKAKEQNKSELSECAKAIAGYEEKLRQAQLSLEEAQAKLDGRNRHWEELKPQLDDMRKMDGDIAIKDKEHKTAIKELEKAHSDQQNAIKEEANLKKQYEARQAEREKVVDFLEQNRVDAELHEKLSGLETMGHDLVDTQKKVEDLDSERRKAEDNLKALQSEFEQLQKQEAAFAAEHKRLEEEKKGKEAEFASLANGKDLPAWRQERDKSRERASSLKQALSTCQQWLSLDDSLADEQAQVSDKEIKLSATQAQRKDKELFVDHLKSERDLREVRVRQQIAYQSLEEHRKELREGQPCPLCGSLEHPLASGVFAYLSENDKDELERVKAELAQAESILVELGNSCVRLGADIEALTKAMGTKLESQRIEAEKLMPWAQELQLCAIEAANREDWRRGLEDLSEKAERDDTTLSELVENLERLEKECREADKEASLANEKLLSISPKVAAKDADIKAAQTRCEEREANSRELRKAFDDAWEKLNQMVLPFQEAKPMLGADLWPMCALSSWDKVLASLKERDSAYREQSDEKVKVDYDIAALDSRWRSALDALSKATQEEQERATEEQKRHAELEAARRERCNRYGEVSADDREKEARAALDEARQACEMLSTQAAETRASHKAKCEQQIKLNAKDEDIDKELSDWEERFADALRCQGFASEEAFHYAKRDEEQIKQWQDRERELSDQKSVFRDKEEKNRAALEEKQKNPLTDLSAEDLNQRSNEMKAERDEALDTKGSIKERLNRQEEDSKRYRDYNEKLQAARAESERWEKLDKVIGDNRSHSDLMRFAQCITFERLLREANEQIQKFNPRYTLCRDDQNDDNYLSVIVIDRMHGNARRSVANLSGGEKFLVSLSLALALSSLASKHTSIDSLFIDEGFGTLSEDLLSTVLDALAGLKKQGKLIGVISHVEQLKEGVSAHIVLEPGTNGRSVLGKGSVGCSHKA